MKKEKVLKLFYLFLLLQPFIDLVTSLMTKFLDVTVTLGLVVRGILFICSCIYILFLSKSKYRKWSIIYLISIFIFLILYFITKMDILSNRSWLVTEVIYIFKYFYTLIMFIGLLNFFDEYKPNNRKIFKTLEFALCVYCFIIVIANITGTAFGTYAGGEGNTGWFYSGNEIGIIITLLFPLLFLLINKADSFKCLFYVIPIVLAIEIIGTKTSMLGLLLPTLIFFVYYLIRIRNDKLKQFLITLVMLGIIGVSFVDLPAMTNVKNSVDRYETRQQIIKENKENKITDKKMEEYSQKVVTSVIFSDRDFYHKQVLKIYNKASITDKLFGLGFVNRDSIHDENIEKLIEMDFHDIYYHYGIIGFILYIIPFIVFTYIIIKLVLKNHFKLNLKQLLLGYISYVGIGIAFIVGHTLGAPALSFYLDIFMIMLLYYLKNGNHQMELDNEKITILALHLGTGGIEKYLSSLVKMLYKDYKIEIISTYKLSDKPSFDFPKSIKITYLIDDYPRKEELKKYLNEKKFIKAMVSFINLAKILFLKYYRNIRTVEEIDSKYIITTRTFHNKIVSQNKNRDVVAIATEHNYHNNDNKYINKLVNSCKNVSYLVLVSEELKEFYASKLKNTECIYIPNVIDNVPNYQKKKKINNKLISVGRLVEEKGYNDLIDIISIVKKDIPKISLDIYGDGPLYNSLEQQIRWLNLEKNIKLKGFCNHSKILNQLKNYDLYTMSSNTESFGLVLVEAMSRSVPCIAFDSANGAKTLLANKNGILIENRNKEDYARKIVQLLNDIDKLNKVGKSGYDSISDYEINNVKMQWLELLSKID